MKAGKEISVHNGYIYWEEQVMGVKPTFSASCSPYDAMLKYWSLGTDDFEADEWLEEISDVKFTKGQAELLKEILDNNSISMAWLDAHTEK